MNLRLLILLLLLGFGAGAQSSLSDTQMQNARATGYAIVAAKNPGKDFSIIVVFQVHIAVVTW